MPDINIQPQGYSATDALDCPLPPESPKRKLWQDLKAKVGQPIQLHTFVGYTTEEVWYDLAGVLSDALIVPTSPAVYRWPHDEMWTVKVRVKKADGELCEAVIDRTTRIAFGTQPVDFGKGPTPFEPYRMPTVE